MSPHHPDRCEVPGGYEDSTCQRGYLEKKRVALTAPDQDLAFGPPAAAAGSEAAGDLAPGMFAFRFSNAGGDKLIVDYNDGGTIKSAELSLA